MLYFILKHTVPAVMLMFIASGLHSSGKTFFLSIEKITKKVLKLVRHRCIGSILASVNTDVVQYEFCTG